MGIECTYWLHQVSIHQKIRNRHCSRENATSGHWAVSLNLERVGLLIFLRSRGKVFQIRLVLQKNGLERSYRAFNR